MEGPGVPVGETMDALVGLEDLMPTIFHAAGIAEPDYLDGSNIYDLFEGKDWRQAYYVQTEKRKIRTLQRCVRTTDWKLILSWDEVHELYDLTVDPEEALNIFDVPRWEKQTQYQHFQDQSGRIAELAEIMLKRASELGDFAGVEMASRVLRQAA